jgi:hypothetical protein
MQTNLYLSINKEFRKFYFSQKCPKNWTSVYESKRIFKSGSEQNELAELVKYSKLPRNEKIVRKRFLGVNFKDDCFVHLLPSIRI